MSERELPRLLLAAPMSGSGKTTITAGLIAALVARGFQVAPFKCGPDYIDPSYHSLAAGRPCHNLDAWLVPPDLIPGILARRSQGADLAVIEGVMGLFDGYAGDDDSGSSAHIARLTNTPVIIVLDARAMARTAAALVVGLRDFDPHVRVAGVICNRVGGPGHAQLLTRAIEDSTGLPVLGCLSRDEAISVPERHLGLVPTAEPGRWQAWIGEVRARIEASIDLDRLLVIARSAPVIKGGQEAGGRRQDRTSDVHAARAHHPMKTDRRGASRRAPTRHLPIFTLRSGLTLPLGQAEREPRGEGDPIIAVARDEAFSFLYEENLDLLREAGAQICFFSPLHDQALPDGTGAIYLCGGFPELYAAQLSENRPMCESLRAAAAAGLPIYAECGGLMYLTEAVVDAEGRTYPLVGLLSGHSTMTDRLTLGYRTVQAQSDSWLWRTGETMRGHEFHYSIWEQRPPTIPWLYACLPDAMRPMTRPEGAHADTILASYIHLHFRAYPDLATRFVAAARRTT